MPLIDIPPRLIKGDDPPFPRVFDPPINGREGFGVFSFCEFGNRVIKLRFGHTCNFTQNNNSRDRLSIRLHQVSESRSKLRDLGSPV